ncbi:hypothetical protein CL1_1492 [Thermococcus cleftensis]|uniref:Uncharacterized protein n=1 Tax=Thermococcus cleftensis (strain DSM 27260 / KACC 17922 / CL1) TaxID=163003 RepID=I3ZVF7_THECF|nr:hypothetical protein [Thermococcus cleftensis]AFL95691.1 hypothetical protein CL1_1492 [Thermococcus cleftensis]
MTIPRVEEIAQNLRECARDLKAQGLSLSWEGLDETALKGGRNLFTAPTWRQFHLEFFKFKTNQRLKGKTVGRREFQAATIRWVRNQQEMLLKAVLNQEFYGRGNILKVVTDDEEMRNFFVDAWISKEYLPLTREDFVKFVKSVTTGQEVFLQGAPIQWKNPEAVTRSFGQAALAAWENVEVIGFDFKNTVANFFSMTKGRSRDLVDSTRRLLDEDDPELEVGLLEALTRGFYENQSRTRQQVTPRVFFTIFVYSPELEGVSRKGDLSAIEKRLVDEFLLEEMESGMKSITWMYREFAWGIINRSVVFHKLLPVKLHFPAVESVVLIASSIVLVVEKTSDGFRPVKVLGV